MTDRQKLARVYELAEILYREWEWLWKNNDRIPRSEHFRLDNIEWNVIHISELTHEAYKDEQRMKNIDKILKDLTDEENGLWATMVKITEDYKKNHNL